MLDYSPALMTDMYEYTMLDACLKDGTANRKCVFEIFTRHLPLGRHYGVAAGQGRILDALEKFHLDDNDLKFLADRKPGNHQMAGELPLLRLHQGLPRRRDVLPELADPAG